jgi:hypothetical protein
MFQPLGNSTVLPAAKWHPEPQTRGTFSILSSCLITMSLCIWTSLHLNLPAHKKEHLQKYRKLGWMIPGLIAPEMVVWNAWSQRKEMKLLSKLMQYKGFMPARLAPWMSVRNELAEVWQWTKICLLLKAKDLPEYAEPTPDRQYNGRIHPWTDVHSWYVLMGGLSFEDSGEEHQRFMPGNRQRINISIDRFIYLLKVRDHLIPDIPREHIQDKSKSDKLAKLLTCWQAGYFCIQCISRLSRQLSVTLLELNVFAHALCALALFAIWSDKPRDIYEPTLIVGEEAMDICAILCLHVVSSNHPECFDCYIIKSPPEYPHEPVEVFHPRSFSLFSDGDILRRYDRNLRDEFTMKVLETYWGLRWRNGFMPPYSEFIITLDARDLRRLQRVSNLVQRERFRPPGLTRIDRHNVPNLGHWQQSMAQTHSWHSATSMPIEFMERDGLTAYQLPDFAWFAAGLTFAGTCYGGLHLVAWKTPLASNAQSLLWRAACVSIMAAGPSYILFAACVVIPRGLYWRYGERHAHRISNLAGQGIISIALQLLMRLLQNALIGVFGSGVLWYIFCRVFIIIESFIMLAHIPDQALEVPTWSAYMPHIV